MENKVKDWIKDNVLKIAFFCIIVFGVILRISFRKFLSHDAEAYLIPWYYEIKGNGGIKGLGVQVGNYNLLYQFFIALFTYIPLNPLSLYKAFSCIFDVALAFVGGVYIKKGDWSEYIAFTCIFLSPIVVLNSSAWGQCDSIYTFFCIVTLYLLLKERFGLSMIFFGIALSFKMQAIFILPFILVYYIMNKKFSIKHFMGTLLSIVVLSIPGCLNGRNIFDTLKVYIGQVKENPDWIFYNYPGISYLFTNADSPVEYVRVTKTLCLITALVVLGSIAAWVIYKKIEMSKYNFLYLAFLMTYAAVLFMPAMHERYGYVYEILAILLAIYDTKTIVGCIALQLCSVITYSRYLFGFGYDVRDARLLAVFNLLVFIGYFIYYIRKIHLTDKTVVTAYSANRKE